LFKGLQAYILVEIWTIVSKSSIKLYIGDMDRQKIGGLAPLSAGPGHACSRWTKFWDSEKQLRGFQKLRDNFKIWESPKQIGKLNSWTLSHLHYGNGVVLTVFWMIKPLFLGAMENILEINANNEMKLFEGDIRLTTDEQKNLDKNALLNPARK